MNRHLRTFSNHLALLLLAFSVAIASGRNAQGQPAPPDKVRLDYHRGRGAPRPLRDHAHHYAYLFDSVSVTGKKRWAGLVRVSNPRNGSIVLPALRNGEIVPAFGALYRVGASELVRLEVPPKGLAVAKGSFVIPLMRDGQGSGQITYRVKDSYEGKMVLVMAITPGERPVAKVKIDDIRTEPREVRVGSVLKLGPTEWEVRSIVPAGRGAIGWVELGKKEVK